MRSFRVSGRRVGRIATTVALLVATIVPSFAPAIASAAQITDRSIELSSSTKGALSVTYALTFTPAASAGATAVQFCSDTPLIGEACGVPAGLNVSAAAVAGSTSVSKPAVHGGNGPVVVIEQAITATPTTLTMTGITNPSAEGTIFARVITYDTKAHAEEDYLNTAGGGDNDGIGGAGAAAANAIDTGSVALAITNGIDVSAAVLETMTFCAASAAITANCANASGNLPNLTLGEGVPKALTSSALSTGDIYTQLSTNASGGAVVRIKSGNPTCSGLALNGDCANQIAAAGTTGTFAAGTAKFGVFVNPTTGSSTGTGTIALTSGDATVTGTGTAWVDTPTVKPGDTIWTNGGRAYTILSITNNTELELTANAAATESTAAYTYGFGTYRVFGGGGTYSDTVNTYRFDETNVKSAYGDAILDTNDGVVNGGNIRLTFGASISNTTAAGKYSNAYSLIATGKF